MRETLLDKLALTEGMRTGMLRWFVGFGLAIVLAMGPLVLAQEDPGTAEEGPSLLIVLEQVDVYALDGTPIGVAEVGDMYLIVGMEGQLGPCHQRAGARLARVDRRRCARAGVGSRPASRGASRSRPPGNWRLRCRRRYRPPLRYPP